MQIYEELVSDPDGEITTSFFALTQHVKEIRLLPKGRRTDGPSADKTGPLSDPDYGDGSEFHWRPARRESKLEAPGD
ncbi:MAG: hypothetical protein ACREVZ_00915 [Burkholderiales bacterium]